MGGRSKIKWDTDSVNHFRPVVSERYQFVYASVAKCGSSTLNEVIAGIHGLGSDVVNALRHHPVSYDGDHCLQRDTELLSYEVLRADVADFRRTYNDFSWFTVVRHPYQRALSTYNYDLRKYAKWHEKGIYLAGGVSKFLASASGRDGKRAQRNAIRKRIPFAAFMQGLRTNGTGFDVHFVPQTDLIFLDLIRYDQVLRLESLSDELPAFLAKLGVSQDTLGKVLPIPRSNPSHQSDAVHDEQTRALVYEIYEKDFTGLGYVP